MKTKKKRTIQALYKLKEKIHRTGKMTGPASQCPLCQIHRFVQRQPQHNIVSDTSTPYESKLYDTEICWGCPLQNRLYPESQCADIVQQITTAIPHNADIYIRAANSKRIIGSKLEFILNKYIDKLIKSCRSIPAKKFTTQYHLRNKNSIPIVKKYDTFVNNMLEEIRNIKNI